jgi:hypothetical protein
MSGVVVRQEITSSMHKHFALKFTPKSKTTRRKSPTKQAIECCRTTFLAHEDWHLEVLTIVSST